MSEEKLCSDLPFRTDPSDCWEESGLSGGGSGSGEASEEAPVGGGGGLG